MNTPRGYHETSSGFAKVDGADKSTPKYFFLDDGDYYYRGTVGCSSADDKLVDGKWVAGGFDRTRVNQEGHRCPDPLAATEALLK